MDVNKAKYNVFTDHLGSILSMQRGINNEFQATYDAWGEQTVKKNNLSRSIGASACTCTGRSSVSLT